MPQLSPQKQKFAQEYLTDLDAEKAAIRAGYSSAYAKKNAVSFLSEPAVVQAISELVDTESRKLKLHKGFFVQKLLNILNFALQEEEITDKSGNPLGKQKIKDVSAALKSIEILLKLNNTNAKNTGLNLEPVLNLDLDAI